MGWGLPQQQTQVPETGFKNTVPENGTAPIVNPDYEQWLKNQALREQGLAVPFNHGEIRTAEQYFPYSQSLIADYLAPLYNAAIPENMSSWGQMGIALIGETKKIFT